jgi:hypothetical protein
MTSTASASQLTPPLKRLPYATFDHFAQLIKRSERFRSDERLGRHSLTDKGLSVSASALLHSSLRSLGLIDARDCPTTTLLSLANPLEEFPRLCEHLLTEHYSWVRGRGGELTDDLRSEFGQVSRSTSGDTLTKEIAFYRQLRVAAGLERGPLVKVPRGRRARAGREQLGQTSSSQDPLAELERLKVRRVQAATMAIERLVAVVEPTADWAAAFTAASKVCES